MVTSMDATGRDSLRVPDNQTNLLPRPVGRQREVLYLPPIGHQVVLGTAGSGKTTLAILRSLFLADPDTEHSGPTLLVTFNKCLVTYMTHLAGSVAPGVKVENYHKFARGYLSSRGALPPRGICSPNDRRRSIRSALRDAAADGVDASALRRPPAFFDEEFQWIQGHGIADRDGYIAAERVGRSGTRITRSDRPALFDVYTHYIKNRDASGRRYDWSELASAVIFGLSSDDQQRRYRHVVVDEGQDFTPEMLRSLALLVPSDGSLTLFGDIAQQIYGQRMSWRTAGLSVRRVWHFRENYRNTKQIAQLALALARMPGFPDDPDLVEPTAPTADGPLPALVGLADERRQRDFVVSRARQLAATGTVAILFRTRQQEWQLPGATRLHRDLSRWPAGPGLFYGTYHAAKGLEFDTVFLPLLSADNWPRADDIQSFGVEEATERNSQLLYVGLTRARSTLAMTYSGQLTTLLPQIRSLYQVSNA